MILISSSISAQPNTANQSEQPSHVKPESSDIKSQPPTHLLNKEQVVDQASKAQGKVSKQSSKDPKKSNIVAQVGSITLSFDELAQKTANELKKAEQEFQQKKYEIQAQEVDRFITETALKLKAESAGLGSIEALLADAVKDLAQPTEVEIKAFYDENKARIGEVSFEEVRGQIIDFLQNGKSREVIQALVTQTKAEYKARDFLEAPRVDIPTGGYSKGPQSAPIRIVEFADFECGYCSRAGDTLNEVMKKYSGKIRVEYRDFPLGFHENAEGASIAARCAGEQGKFWEMHDHLFKHQNELNPTQYTQWATELGLDTSRFEECAKRPDIARAVQKDMEIGTSVGVSGTPAFFINGISLSGAQPLEAFIQVIDRELQR